MRKLTITRNKSFAGCAAALKVYIADPTGGEITINNTPARRLGTIKNGETVTFEIENTPQRVFVIAGQMSKSYYSEFYDIGEGDTDVFLTGKCYFGPMSGNPFRFDNNFGEAALANRKSNKGKGRVIAVISIVIGVILGGILGGVAINSIKNSPKEITCRDMTMTLTESFDKFTEDDFDACYSSNDVAVYILEESFSLAPEFGNYTVREYIDLVKYANGDNGPVLTHGDLVYYTYTWTNPKYNETYVYYAFAYKEDDAFWLIQFATFEDNLDEYEEKFFEWASGVQFS